MVCPNCHSHDFIAVQDQLFCVSCGRLTTPAEVQAEKLAVVASAPPPKRSVGRPRAIKLDSPLPPTPAPVKPAPAAIAQIAPRSLSDIRPVQPRPLVAPAKPVKPPSRPPRPHLAIGSIIKASLHALHPLWIVWAAPGAALIAVGLILGAWALFYHGALLMPWQPSVRVAGELIAALGLITGGYGWLHLTRAAVIFHRAGVNDHRLTASSTAWQASIARTARLIGLRLFLGLTGIITLAFLGTLVWYGGRSSALPSALQLTLVFIGCFGLLYLLGSLWVVERLIEAGIVISGLSVKVANHLSWRFCRHHWELLGLRLVALTSILSVGGAIAFGLFLMLRDTATIVQFGAASAALTILFSVLTVISGGAAEATYRLLVELERPQRALQLLGGRRSLRPSIAAIILLSLGLVLPLGIAAAALIYLR